MSTQVSGYISEETKASFEAFAKKSGQKKGFILEQALLHYISVHEELPDDIIIPPSITITKDTFDSVVSTEKPPTKALKKLMNES